MTRRRYFTGPLLFILVGFAAFISGCAQETATVTPLIPTIDELPLVARDVPVTSLLRNPYSYEDAHVRISGRYLPLPLMACKNDPHTSPATWVLSDGTYEVPAAGFDTVLRKLGVSDIPLVVEGRWRFWDGPVGCGRRAPNEEIWHLEVSRIVSPNPLSQIVVYDQEIAEAPNLTTTVGPLEDVSEDNTRDIVPTSVATLIPTASPTLAATPTRVASETPEATGTTLVTQTAAANATTSTPTPIATQTEEVASTPSATAEDTVTPETPTATTTPTVEPTATQDAPTSAGSLDFEEISRSGLGIGGAHIWDFEVIEDDVISISAGPAANLDIAIELVGPDGTTIAVKNDGANGQGESISQLTLSISGSYQLEIRAVGGTAGFYSVVLTNEDSEAFLIFKENLIYGGLGTGSLPSLTDHLWNFQASSGDQITINVDPANNDDLVVFLISPDSTELIFVDDTAEGESEQITDFVINETGTYTIRIGELEFQEASYTVTLNGS